MDVFQLPFHIETKEEVDKWGFYIIYFVKDSNYVLIAEFYNKELADGFVAMSNAFVINT